MQNQFKLITLFILLFTVSHSFSQTKTYKNELGFKSENDSFLALGQDRYYTNGLFIHFRSALKPKSNTNTVYLVKKIWSASIGQYMYNAQTGAVPNATYVDRPFAAYLYAEGALQVFDKKENSGKISLQVGTIGPNALGEEAQQLMHDTFGFYELNGWQYQVNNELGINLKLNSLVFLHRSKDKKVDFSLPLEARIGNTFSGLKYGLLFRTGTLNPLYHSVATNSNISVKADKNINEKEFYFFLQPAIDVVIYDATIKGGLFRSDKGPITFKSKPIILSNEIGVAYAKNRWTVDFSVIVKSKETKSMVHSTHQYGSFDLYYRF